MRYTDEERMDIARRVYEGELTLAAAAVEYELSRSSVKRYVSLYREKNNLPIMKAKGILRIPQQNKGNDAGLEDYESMSREELIDALVMAKINETRLKKGYSVKGSGATKEYIPIDNKNTK